MIIMIIIINFIRENIDALLIYVLTRGTQSFGEWLMKMLKN